MPERIRVSIVGAGNVGATFAYALLLSGLASEIVLIDANRAKAEGEAMDLAHTEPFAHATRVWAGDISDCSGAAITVVAAGSNQKSAGETRLELLKRNADTFKQIVPEIARHNPNGIILVATNPVDVLTYASLKYSGLPPTRVIGSGTILDTARFRYLLSVHAYIIGEHGDSEVPVWSLANIAGLRLPAFCAAQGLQFHNESMADIFTQTRDAAYHIIERKGATFYAVAAGLMRICEAILRDQNTVLSVSGLVRDYYGISDICFSLPSIVNRDGIHSVLRLGLSDDEAAGLRRSAEVLKKTAEQLEL
jgi:L-lactate dehydrogenase